MRDILFIALYEAKLLSRKWEFRLFVFFSLIGITLCHVFLQGKGYDTLWSLVALPCSLPWLNAYLFSVIQSLFLMILMSDVPRSENREGALDAIYTRPLNNGDYTWGRVGGYLFLFVLVNLVVMGVCMLFVHVGSVSPFALKYYVFYFLTLNIPSFVFVTGFGLWLARLVRVRYLVIVLQFLLLVASVSWLPFRFHGTFDFLGSGIPSFFSDLTGHVSPWNYFLQRVAYLFIGLGFLICGVRYMKRIPNNSGRIKMYSFLGYMVVLVGVVCLVMLEMNFRSIRQGREAFQESFVKHWKEKPCRVTEHDIRVEQVEDRLRLTSRLTLHNLNSTTVEQPLLFLNPGLKISSLESNGQSLSYRRDQQIVVLEHPLEPGDSLCLTLHYEGEIDERFCSLHVRDEEFEASFRVNNRFLPVGRRGAFVEKDYLLLPSACVWYPMAVPPVNPVAPMLSGKDLTRYSLAVVRPRQKMTFSQGVSLRRGDTTIFRPSGLLPGISLCGGNFRVKKLETGDLRLLLCMFKGHEELIRNYSNLSQRSIRDFFVNYFYPQLDFPLSRLNWYEEKTHNLFFIETPLSFCMETIPGKTTGGQVEPGLVLLSERGFDMGCDRLLHVKPEGKEDRDEIFNAEEDSGFSELDMCLKLSWAVKGDLKNERLGYFLSNLFKSSFTCVNPINAMSLFRESGVWIYSEEYPFAGYIFEQLLMRQRVDAGSQIIGNLNTREREVLDNLRGLSLEDVFRNGEVDEMVFYDLLKWKRKELVERLSIGIPEDTFFQVLKEVYLSCPSIVTLDEFAEKLDGRLGIDTKQIFSEWYRARHEQFYKTKDWCTHYCYHKGGERYFQVGGKIMNCGKEGGIVTVQVVDLKTTRYYKCFLKPGEAKAFTMSHESPIFAVRFDFGLSANRPHELFVPSKEKFISVSEFIPEDGKWISVDTSEFAVDLREVIVDDCDLGFSFSDGDLTFLQKWFGKKPVIQYSVWPCVDTYRWTRAVGQFHGDSVRSCYYKSFGSGKCSASWTAALSEGGRYRITANVSRVLLEIRGSSYPPGGVVYHYTVKQGKWEEKVDVSLDEQLGVGLGAFEGWVSLGEFDFSKGEVCVTLSDRDDECRKNIAVMADAVKWTRIDE